MAWFAISLRAPWSSPSESTLTSSAPTSRSPSLSPPASPARICSPHQGYFLDDAMYMPRLPPRPAQVYTVRIIDPNLRPKLLKRLREVVRSAGGMEIVDLMEGRGFIFSMPPAAQNPLTGYQHGGLLEEGCIVVTKTVLRREDPTGRKGLERYSRPGGTEEEAREEEYGKNHPNLGLQWEWTEADLTR